MNQIHIIAPTCSLLLSYIAPVQRRAGTLVFCLRCCCLSEGHLYFLTSRCCSIWCLSPTCGEMAVSSSLLPTAIASGLKSGGIQHRVCQDLLSPLGISVRRRSTLGVRMTSVTASSVAPSASSSHRVYRVAK